MNYIGCLVNLVVHMWSFCKVWPKKCNLQICGNFFIVFCSSCLSLFVTDFGYPTAMTLCLFIWPHLMDISSYIFYCRPFGGWILRQWLQHCLWCVWMYGYVKSKNFLSPHQVIQLLWQLKNIENDFLSQKQSCYFLTTISVAFQFNLFFFLISNGFSIFICMS